MARSTVFKAKPQYKVLSPQSPDELEVMLREAYPDNRINAFEFQQILGSPLAVSIIKSDLGSDRNWYSPKELADYLWHRSNYNEAEQDPYSASF